MKTNLYPVVVLVMLTLTSCHAQQNPHFEKTAVVLKDTLLTQSKNYLKELPITDIGFNHLQGQLQKSMTLSSMPQVE